MSRNNGTCVWVITAWRGFVKGRGLWLDLGTNVARRSGRRAVNCVSCWSRVPESIWEEAQAPGVRTGLVEARARAPQDWEREGRRA